jgi:hypothetical protein
VSLEFRFLSSLVFATETFEEPHFSTPGQTLHPQLHSLEHQKPHRLTPNPSQKSRLPKLCKSPGVFNWCRQPIDLRARQSPISTDSTISLVAKSTCYSNKFFGHLATTHSKSASVAFASASGKQFHASIPLCTSVHPCVSAVSRLTSSVITPRKVSEVRSFAQPPTFAIN